MIAVRQIDLWQRPPCLDFVNIQITLCLLVRHSLVPPLNSPGTPSNIQTYVESEQVSSSHFRPPVTPKAKTTADSEAASCHSVHTYRSTPIKLEGSENVTLERNPFTAQLVDQRPDRRSMNTKRNNNHLKCRHPYHVKTDADKFCRFKLQPIVASHETPKESREWECPWFFKGPPACTGQKQRHTSIQLHWKTDHPNEDT